MKALTVQQPWAHAIVHLGKDVENRSQLWSYRGPLAIHAGKTRDRNAPDAILAQAGATQLRYGAIIGVVDLIGVHRAPSCACSPWAFRAILPSGYPWTHLVLINPRAVDPIPCRGRLGLWDLPDDIAEVLGQPTGVTA